MIFKPERRKGNFNNFFRIFSKISKKEKSEKILVTLVAGLKIALNMLLLTGRLKISFFPNRQIIVNKYYICTRNSEVTLGEKEREIFVLRNPA